MVGVATKIIFFVKIIRKEEDRIKAQQCIYKKVLVFYLYSIY
jgi:hypothetical protein